MREYFVYMLECRGGRLYTGYTVDARKRFESHVSGKGGARFTRGFRPLKVAALWIVRGDRGSAQKIEALIKSLNRGAKEALVSDPSLLAGMVSEKGIESEVLICDISGFSINPAEGTGAVR